jgi:hypothetical protein
MHGYYHDHSCAEHYGPSGCDGDGFRVSELYYDQCVADG